ncbi:endoglucanase [Halobacteriales archaeon QS_1_68_17]|nr:MAG: endoglucanase [Halobacteriales archaeon QS_1_68_17]
MDKRRRELLDSLLRAPGPSGFETAVQRVWIDYVEEYADEVRTDAYGNAVARLDGDDRSVALTGHADQIGFVVRRIDEDGFLHIERIGGMDRTVTRGQYVRVHADDGSVPGVIGQTAIHLRDRDEDAVADVNEQRVDVGAADREAAESLVSVGDPITVETRVRDLGGTRIAAPAMDNRIGLWAAAEGFRRAAERDPGATVYAVSTVQEEVGGGGAKMVGFDLAPDAALVADVTHATDTPDVPGEQQTGVELGDGPTVERGQPNHPELTGALRAVADEEGIDVQLEAVGTGGYTDAHSLFVQRGGIPTQNVGLPNRYMHTPVEVIDADDLDAMADLLAGAAVNVHDHAPFAVGP